MNRIIRLAVPLAVLGALTGCGDSPETLLGKANDSFAAEDYQKARLQLASALRDEPENHEILLLMARTQLRLHDPDGAEGILTRLERAGFRSAEVPRIKAQIALLRQKPDDALALVGDDSSVEGWRIRAEAQLALNHDTQAVEAFEQGMKAGGNIAIAEAYARYRLVSNDFSGADSVYRQMKKIAPDSYETLVMAGDLAAARGQTDNAIASYRKVVDAYPDRVAPMLALANQYDAKGKLDEAGEMVEKAGKLSPNNPQIEALKYQLLSEKGEWEKIRIGLQGREAQLEPGSGLQMTYAEALLRLGHAEQARILFNRAMLALPGNPYSRMMLGEAQLATGDAQSAWETLRPLATSTLARPEVLESAEKAARAVGAPEAVALKARLDPTRLKPTMTLVRQGDMAVMHQDWDTVLDVYGKLLPHGEDPEVLKRLALATSKLGRASEAIAYADRTLAVSPGNPDYLYLAGQVRLDSGQDLAGARRLLEAAAAADPRNTVIARALRKAKAAAG
ncbi:tetratricopeptide repeat protein [Novosphingobium mangrovi (ex Huang et al. 2023)]|uniref:Tetratricopeptide repeat protein n=1 Tax=Novosphingobium mangrovi (ex Huang et al. 2023) TaxID=2976432 RepID=A0ABT2I7F3_9SPHN|nr:tetratricopeptide repeat protein [Novosphingobium mangrovi (ex Huang et al. 2023)]MCT2400755.1 tetratricopeptide repeat protein [Novosphingobium mangrovi (ex Huang et al. 2023)]